MPDNIAFNAGDEDNESTSLPDRPMATLTIRNVDDRLKGRLRVRAALRGQSMEEEARQILRAALDEPEPAATNLAQRIRRRFAKLGDVQIPIAPREAVRRPERVEDPSAKSAIVSPKARSAKAVRRT